MSKLLVLILVIAVVVVVWWAVRRPTVERASAAKLQSMVSCAHCGLHVPVAEAVMFEERPYCTAAHRDLGPRLPG